MSAKMGMLCEEVGNEIVCAQPNAILQVIDTHTHKKNLKIQWQSLLVTCKPSDFSEIEKTIYCKKYAVKFELPSSHQQSQPMVLPFTET